MHNRITLLNASCLIQFSTIDDQESNIIFSIKQITIELNESRASVVNIDCFESQMDSVVVSQAIK